MTALIAKWKSLTEPARASVATAGCRIFVMAISFLTTPVFTRLMTTEEYGTYTVIFSWLEVIYVFATLNIAGGSLQQALVKYDNKKNELMAAVAGLGTAASLVTFAVYLMFRKWLDPVFGFGPLIFGCITVLSWAVLMSDIWTAYQKVGYRYRAKIHENSRFGLW